MAQSEGRRKTEARHHEWRSLGSLRTAPWVLDELPAFGFYLDCARYHAGHEEAGRWIGRQCLENVIGNRAGVRLRRWPPAERDGRRSRSLQSDLTPQSLGCWSKSALFFSKGDKAGGTSMERSTGGSASGTC